MLKLERIDLDACDWSRMDAFADREIFQTREWLDFIASANGAEPVVCAVRNGSSTVGYFTGAIVQRFGVRILGSPFPGWQTFYMGFNLEEGISRRDAASALRSFAFGPLRCFHLELRDRNATPQEFAGLGFQLQDRGTFEVDLLADEEEIFARMTSACRRCIRKAEKSGVIIEEVNDLEFADEYYAQLEDVFAKQSLRPTYGIGRVRRLLEHLLPTGRILLLRARREDGKCIATAIFPAFGRAMYFWGGASWRADQILRPNEAIFWYAMRYWKHRGGEVLDLHGPEEYKRKYGGRELMVPLCAASRVRGLSELRRLAHFLHNTRRTLTPPRSATR
jgi:hypothetical protein